MTRKARPASDAHPAEDRSTRRKNERAPSDRIDRPRLLRLALQYSVIEMSRLPGFPSADVIYRELVSDAAFERDFATANNVQKQARRAELADLLKRSRTTDLSRIFIELRKLREQVAVITGESAPPLDLSRLSDDDILQLDRILRKATPADTSDTNEDRDNDGHLATHP